MSSIATVKQISENLAYTSHGYANPGIRKLYKRRSNRLERVEARSLIAEQLEATQEMIEADWEGALIEDTYRWIEGLGKLAGDPFVYDDLDVDDDSWYDGYDY